MTRSVDVAVVGGGPVGLLLACLLAAGGADVVVCERRERPAGVPRAIGVHPPGLTALERAGVGPAVRAEAAPIRRGLALCAGRELARVRFDAQPVLSLPQDRTEALLEARLAQLAPGALRRGHDVTAVRERPDGIEVELAGGAAVLSARYVVAADGVRSPVRDMLGIGSLPRRGHADYVMADASGTGTEAEDEAVIHLEPDGVVESFPLPGGRRRWVIRVPRETAPTDGEGFAALLAHRLGVRTPGRALTVPSAFTARQRLSERFARGRAVLVGDAAHEISPIGGQGMNLGWIDAVDLAATLADALDDGARAAPFAEYERRRRRSASRATRRAAFNMAMGAPVGGVRRLARDAAVRMLARPPAREALARAFTMHGI
ncbi:NAD(P)/FAD-dependent oxidoreductase [Microbacterium sp. Marseille-Q6965]|uniref:FAD-dependent oxidoreductase n=1 Tax=Microbacterium sp. Marseille-Q6965 TaxID=2965072 RepID=UPI0021B81601|nr:NAD(P)/FAD-dependent oxidoreductase [Microbacterium sp. Marseille-Q6965]